MQIGSQVLKVKRKRREILQTVYLRPLELGSFLTQEVFQFKYESVNLATQMRFLVWRHQTQGFQICRF